MEGQEANRRNSIEDGGIPRVSVIIPAYNHEGYIGEALQSVLSQSFEDFEIIVIDDGSKDHTPTEINRFQDPRMRFFEQENKGAARTINRGISLSRGEFISILNSDDVYHPERLARMVSLMEGDPDCVIAASFIRPIDRYGKPADSEPEYELWRDWYREAVKNLHVNQDPYSSLLRHNFVVSTSNIFVRSSVFRDEKAFNPLLAYCHDYEFLLRIIGRHKFSMVEEELLSYRLHERNTIRENEFLKHLEVLYTIFSTVDMRELLAKNSYEERMMAPIFGGLFGNPELNREKYSFEYLEIIKEKNRNFHELKRELEDREEKLIQADGWLKKAAHDNEQLVEKVEKTEKKLEEIYRSKGWLWLTRYRKVKIRLKHVKIISWMRRIFSGEAVMDSTTERFAKPGIYRKLKSKLGQETARPSDERSGPEFVQHIRILHPLERQRPIVIHAIANFMTGGSSRLVADLIERLGHRYEQEVITSYAPNPPMYSGFPIHEFPKSKARIASFLKQKKTEILHVHYWGDCDDPWYRRVFGAAGEYRCVVIENVNTPVEAYVDGVIDHYVFVSNHARNFGLIVPDPATVIYPGSDLEMFKRNGAPIEDNTIGMVYRLEKDKLREDAVQVFIDVVKRRPGTKALIVGGGTFLESYRRQVEEQGLSESFEFTGYVPYNSLPDYYRRFSVFVAPVWKESFGQVSPFAMGMEIPVAGYNVGALSEILDGEECLARSRKELADVIIDLLDDREKRLRIGAKNRDRAVKHFSLEVMVKQYELLYQSLLSR